MQDSVIMSLLKCKSDLYSLQNPSTERRIEKFVSFCKIDSVFANLSFNEHCVVKHMNLFSRNKGFWNNRKIVHFETYAQLNNRTKLNCSLMFTLSNFCHRVQKVQ